MSGPSIRGLVFDLDETLVDSRTHILRYQRDLFAWLGRPFPEDEEESFFTLDREALEHRFFTAAEIARLPEFRRQSPYEARLGEIVPKPGAALLVGRLARGRTPLGILTNRGTSTPRLLAQCGWGGVFAPVLSADVALRPKPDPWGLLTIAESWRLPAATLAFIGDSAVDIACARAAGAFAVRVGDRERGGDTEFADLDGLADWLESAGLLAPDQAPP